MTPEALTDARKALGLTQTALAEKLGVHATNVNRWERGHAKIPSYLSLALYGLGQFQRPRVLIDPEDGHIA